MERNVQSFKALPVVRRAAPHPSPGGDMEETKRYLINKASYRVCIALAKGLRDQQYALRLKFQSPPVTSYHIIRAP